MRLPKYPHVFGHKYVNVWCHKYANVWCVMPTFGFSSTNMPTFGVTLKPTPYTLHPTPETRHPTPQTLQLRYGHTGAMESPHTSPHRRHQCG